MIVFDVVRWGLNNGLKIRINIRGNKFNVEVVGCNYGVVRIIKFLQVEKVVSGI